MMASQPQAAASSHKSEAAAHSTQSAPPAPQDGQEAKKKFDDQNAEENRKIAEAYKVETVQEEQLKRSAEIEAMGTEKWKAAHDTRSAEEKKAMNVVPGVSPTQKDDPGAHEAHESPKAGKK